ncbi:FHA domain-containing protein [Pseudonocardia phyllosphaerae]|uniref:FHA domain-containing protein n=1 Tax=Pseudonocardia phyllosphaerae TaxID=3390502 RepID=UPI00397B3205
MDDRRSAEHTLYLQTLTSDITMPPKEGRVLLFGRNRPDVHVGVGEDDPRVSRTHGRLVFSDGRWHLEATGQRPIRFAADGRLLYAGQDPVPLQPGYLQLLALGSADREHVLELRISGPDHVAAPAPNQETLVRSWPLDDTEHTVCVVLARRYLQNDPNPVPQSWTQIGEEMQHIQPGAGWTRRRAEHTVRAVRERLAAAGVRGLLADDVEPPVGTQLNDNLVAELIATLSIRPDDLERLDTEHP